MIHIASLILMPLTWHVPEIQPYWPQLFPTPFFLFAEMLGLPTNIKNKREFRPPLILVGQGGLRKAQKWQK